MSKTYYVYILATDPLGSSRTELAPDCDPGIRGHCEERSDAAISFLFFSGSFPYLIPHNPYHPSSAGLTSKPFAEGKTVTEVLKKAKAKGVPDPYIVKGLPKGINAFF